MENIEIETNAETMDNSVIFHVIKDVMGFILYMHQQIPSVFQDIGLEFDALKDEYHELEMDLAQAESNASVRRKHMGKIREVKGKIRRLEKLMYTVSGLESALKLIISEIPSLESFILVVGASPIRPQHVYELCFSRGKSILRDAIDFTKTKAAEGLSRKAIRALIAKGVGSDSYPAPSSFTLPPHFLPKRGFRYSKKITPVRLQLKCKSQNLKMDIPDSACQTSSSINLGDSTSNEFIWFQCRQVVKGLAFATPTEE
ncbi:uncharacterized protein LOC110645130 isoform X2 [Hevea brasiliensis]|uniref:uncharacterized protein LOC110645130 isoform X2 n=1 Tax=Hevea brasiliensis TaxID=3981 RepID=UPI000B791FAF|nr:uncharacterized protein LOC110645130 isoform X2 [Hevea brasiliensis]